MKITQYLQNRKDKCKYISQDTLLQANGNMTEKVTRAEDNKIRAKGEGERQSFCVDQAIFKRMIIKKIFKNKEYLEELKCKGIKRVIIIKYRRGNLPLESQINLRGRKEGKGWMRREVRLKGEDEMEKAWKMASRKIAKCQNVMKQQ